ncbi:hypothetical protein [Murimonas intestini]|uniref:Uncharacterized protein n=1 Tax=Murimonas intestini TaxID=1337051 RepID=A0AB73SZP9_9FIRM|nr:hypothetical protein [Murimonas intestini]MCR1842750.1 hypothetical protein [Murimonas intestini]MCR1867911.1 hypothetical protein [Murimonas intestini]MCR1885263.1 hypothetical protein [Murimonas intestini]
MIKRVTSFMHHTTGEGERLTFTYSEINDDGTSSKDNIKGSIIVLDKTISQKLADITDFINGKLPE